LWGVPHSVLRGRPAGAWRDTDRLLALALTTHEDSLCSGCGVRKDRAYNQPDMEGWFAVHAAKCEGCAALELDAKQHDDRTRADKVYVVDERPSGDVPKLWTPS
jgi:hypothetical protein